MKVSERRGREAVYARSDGLCELCGQSRAHSFHHRLKRSHGGGWEASNGLHLCGDGVRGCHGRIEANPAWARGLGLWVSSGSAVPPPSQIPVMTWRGMVHLADDGTWTKADE